MTSTQDRSGPAPDAAPGAAVAALAASPVDPGAEVALHELATAATARTP